MGILRATIGLMIENVITCLCNNMCGYEMLIYVL